MDGTRLESVCHGEEMDLGLDETVHKQFARTVDGGAVAVVVWLCWLYAVQQFLHFQEHAFCYGWQLGNQMH